MSLNDTLPCELYRSSQQLASLEREAQNMKSLLNSLQAKLSGQHVQETQTVEPVTFTPSVQDYKTNFCSTVLIDEGFSLPKPKKRKRGSRGKGRKKRNRSSGESSLNCSQTECNAKPVAPSKPEKSPPSPLHGRFSRKGKISPFPWLSWKRDSSPKARDGWASDGAATLQPKHLSVFNSTEIANSEIGKNKERRNFKSNSLENHGRTRFFDKNNPSSGFHLSRNEAHSPIVMKRFTESTKNNCDVYGRRRFRSISSSKKTKSASEPSSSSDASPTTEIAGQPIMTETSNHSPKRTMDAEIFNEKADIVLSLVSVLGMHNNIEELPDYKHHLCAKLFEMSKSAENCIALRRTNCLPLMIDLLHPYMEAPEIFEADSKSLRTREQASTILRNIVLACNDQQQAKRELRVLNLLEQIRSYCDELRRRGYRNKQLQTRCEADPGVLVDRLEFDHYPIPAMAALMKMSFDEDHRQAISLLGGLHPIVELLILDCQNLLYRPNTSINGLSLNTMVSRYACMALTNLTFGDALNKTLICSLPTCLKTIVLLTECGLEDLAQVAASVVRNLSWRADSKSKLALRNAATVPILMRAALFVTKESTLKSILSALWNLSAHSSENKADICKVPGALEFLIGTLTYKSPSPTLCIVENGGGILRNVSSYIAMDEECRQILRENHCLKILLTHLRSASLTVVSNACGTLWNLSARNVEDQQTLWELGAVSMLKNLVHSKHKMISMGSAAALKNLMAAKPNLNSSSSKQKPLHSGSLQSRKDSHLEQELKRRNLAETSDYNDSFDISNSTSPSTELCTENNSAFHTFPGSRQASKLNFSLEKNLLGDYSKDLKANSGRRQEILTTATAEHLCMLEDSVSGESSGVESPKVDIYEARNTGMRTRGGRQDSEQSPNECSPKIQTRRIERSDNLMSENEKCNTADITIADGFTSFETAYNKQERLKKRSTCRFIKTKSRPRSLVPLSPILKKRTSFIRRRYNRTLRSFSDSEILYKSNRKWEQSRHVKCFRFRRLSERNLLTERGVVGNKLNFTCWMDSETNSSKANDNEFENSDLSRVGTGRMTPPNPTRGDVYKFTFVDDVIDTDEDRASDNCQSPNVFRPVAQQESQLKNHPDADNLSDDRFRTFVIKPKNNITEETDSSHSKLKQSFSEFESDIQLICEALESATTTDLINTTVDEIDKPVTNFEQNLKIDGQDVSTTDKSTKQRPRIVKPSAKNIENESEVSAEKTETNAGAIRGGRKKYGIQAALNAIAERNTKKAQGENTDVKSSHISRTGYNNVKPVRRLKNSQTEGSASRSLPQTPVPLTSPKMMSTSDNGDKFRFTGTGQKSTTKNRPRSATCNSRAVYSEARVSRSVPKQKSRDNLSSSASVKTVVERNVNKNSDIRPTSAPLEKPKKSGLSASSGKKHIKKEQKLRNTAAWVEQTTNGDKNTLPRVKQQVTDAAQENKHQSGLLSAKINNRASYPLASVKGEKIITVRVPERRHEPVNFSPERMKASPSAVVQPFRHEPSPRKNPLNTKSNQSQTSVKTTQTPRNNQIHVPADKQKAVNHSPVKQQNCEQRSMTKTEMLRERFRRTTSRNDTPDESADNVTPNSLNQGNNQLSANANTSSVRRPIAVASKAPKLVTAV